METNTAHADYFPSRNRLLECAPAPNYQNQRELRNDNDLTTALSCTGILHRVDSGMKIQTAEKYLRLTVRYEKIHINRLSTTELVAGRVMVRIPKDPQARGIKIE